MEACKPTRLLIVAHPDDETIFAGNEILQHKTYIVCLTNGNCAIRKAEFLSMLKATNNEGIILSFPDLVNGKKSRWEDCQNEIKETIQNYVVQTQWQYILTHNPKGEYGHIHHILTSKLVSEVVLALQLQDRLAYFAPYYSLAEASLRGKTLNAEEEEAKRKLALLYDSQKKVVENILYLFGYEYFVAYEQKAIYFE